MLAAAGALEVDAVDLDSPTIEKAREAFGSDRIRFRTADAVEALRALDPGAVDAIVCFETLEHLPDFEPAIERLAELARAGVRLVLSVPNSRTLREENEFHLTDFGYDEALRAFERIEGATVLFQHVAEGSLIVGDDPVRGGTVHGLEEADPDYAHCFIAVAGFPGDRFTRATAEMGFVAVPNLNRHMVELHHANQELWRTNQRLMREHLGRGAAPAAVAVGRYERQIDDLKTTLVQREARIKELEVVAKRNDDLYQQQLAWHDAARYRAVDRVFEIACSIPGIVALTTRLRRLVARRS
jgi:SAM-dependent methyltransferase